MVKILFATIALAAMVSADAITDVVQKIPQCVQTCIQAAGINLTPSSDAATVCSALTSLDPQTNPSSAAAQAFTACVTKNAECLQSFSAFALELPPVAEACQKVSGGGSGASTSADPLASTTTSAAATDAATTTAATTTTAAAVDSKTVVTTAASSTVAPTTTTKPSSAGRAVVGAGVPLAALAVAAAYVL
ncbi:hypothetical protein HDU97_008947 [Phlyctochytrium planicorne]|nr:hypothetical protein HDU97_008947 [Phlyctochytrium planicorne]